jgi:predicted anti-sigma-YlaC factor YlaD
LHRDFAAGKIPPEAVARLSPTMLLELATAVFTIDRVLPDHSLAAQIAQTVTGSTAFGLRLALTARAPTDFADALVHFDPAVQLAALDELTRIIKTDNVLPPPDILALIFTHRQSMSAAYLHALFAFASVALALPIPPEIADQALRICIGDWFASPVASNRGCTIIKRTLADATPEQLALMNAFCLAKVRAGAMTSVITDVFTHVCQKQRNTALLFAETDAYFRSVSGPVTIPIAEALAVTKLSRAGEGDDASVVLPPSDYFFQKFNAILAAEKREREMGHAKVTQMYSGVYSKALQLLEDPKFRIFAPVLAMFPDDRPVPPEIDEFLEAQGDRIARVHVVESAHEW